jgi:hypothetical protein
MRQGVNLREKAPRPHNILHNSWIATVSNMGLRPNPNEPLFRRVTKSGQEEISLKKVTTGHPYYPVVGRDTAKSGLGFIDNHHLNNLVESISVNVGGFYRDVKVSSPPMTDRSVGGVIVVGVRESRTHGEGR